AERLTDTVRHDFGMVNGRDYRTHERRDAGHGEHSPHRQHERDDDQRDTRDRYQQRPQRHLGSPMLTVSMSGYRHISRNGAPPAAATASGVAAVSGLVAIQLDG